MNEYYAVIRQDNALAHYGVRGMKWGVRKAIARGTGIGNSSQFIKAKKKLIGLSDEQKSSIKKATRRGGIIGGLRAASKMQNNGSPSSSTVKQSMKKTLSKDLRRQAIEASNEKQNAYNNLSVLGKRGFGKTAKAYKNASRNAATAASNYYNSLNKKQYAKLRRNHIG